MYGMSGITVKAHAKLNLTLEVLGRRPDGYHEIASVMQSISIADTLTIDPADDVTVAGSVHGLAMTDDLTYKAAVLLKERTGYAGGAKITLTKRIPEAGGLGGGSADAGAALVALNDIWRTKLSREQLAEMGATIGSDVPFFIYGGTTLAKGRGEKVTPLKALSKQWLVVVPVPIRIEGKTKRLYSLLERNSFTAGKYTEHLRTVIESGGEFTPDMCYNIFDSVANSAYDGIRKHLVAMVNAGARYVHVAGSGPTLYAFVANEGAASEICEQLEQADVQAMKAWTV